MSGIFGIFYRDGAPLAPRVLDRMRHSMAAWGPDGGAVWHAGGVGLGQARLLATPEARYELLPRVDSVTGTVFTAAARVDNRARVGRLLSISTPEQAVL